jgi:hypothetical protein
MNTRSALFLSFSLLSVVSCCFLIYSYLRFSVLRRFPSNLVVWRAVCDLIFSLQLIAFTIVNEHSTPSNSLCIPFSFLRYVLYVCLSLSTFLCLPVCLLAHSLTHQPHPTARPPLSSLLSPLSSLLSPLSSLPPSYLYAVHSQHLVHLVGSLYFH